MRSRLTRWFLKLKLEVTLEEAARLRSQVLDLRSHGLDECPVLLAKLPSEYLLTLKCVLFQSNLLSYFPRINCRTLDGLQALTLDYNRLVDIPFDFRHLKNLTILNVSHNNFPNLRFFHVVCQLKNLRILWANATGIDEIPVEIGALTKLRVLGLRRNRIRSIPTELLSLPSLRWLTLASNNIAELPHDINRLCNLVHLNLQRNFLRSLPETFNRLQELQYLFLDYNMFSIDSDFKDFISSLPNLKNCSCSGNVSSDLSSTVPLIQEIEENGITSRNNSVNQVTSITSVASLAAMVTSRIEGIGNNSVERFHSTGNRTPGEFQDPSSTQGQDSATDLSHSSGENSNEWGNARLSGYEDILEKDLVQMTEDDNLQEHFQDINWSPMGSDNEYSSESENDDKESTQPVGIVFSWHAQEGENTLVNTCDGKQLDMEMTQDFQHPFENPSVISVGEKASLLPAQPPADNFSRHDYENGNSAVRLPPRIRRTQEWILHQQNSHSQGAQEEARLKLEQRVKSHVEDCIEEAAILVGENKASGVSPSAVSSASLIFLMPHGKKFQLHALSASASCTCTRTVSSSVFVTPSDDNLRAASAHHQFDSNLSHSSIHQPEHRSLDNNVEDIFDNVRANDPVESIVPDIGARISSRLVLPENDDENESNYDPSDWEHSAPSSAIDDQDIITRFAEVEDDEEREDNDFELLNELDWRRIIPLALIR